MRSSLYEIYRTGFFPALVNNIIQQSTFLVKYYPDEVWFFTKKKQTRSSILLQYEKTWDWMNQGVKDMGLYLSFAFSGAKDR